jgi:hypothetical protein
MANGFGGGGSVGGAQSTTTSQYPVDIAKLIKNVQGQIGRLTTGQVTQQNLNTFLNNPLSSDLFQGTISTLLDSLRPSEEAARTALADQFRMAGSGQGGALQSGAFAKAAQLNEQNILQNRSNVVAQRASETFRNILSGLGLGLQAEEAQATPARLGVGLIGAIRPTGSTQSGSSSSSSSGWENIPPSLGLGTPMSGDASRISRAPAISGGSYYRDRPYDPYSPLNPGKTPEEKAFYSNYGYLPSDLGYSELNYNSGGGGYNIGLNPVTGSYESTPFTGFSGLNAEQIAANEY